MRRAIDLDGELGPHAEEVCEVRAYGLLATKPEATELTAAQVLPEPSLKSFKKKDAPPAPPPDDPGNPTVSFRGEKRSNETQASTSAPESRLARKSNGTTAKLSFSAHSLMENRKNGLLIDFRIAAATGTAERETALAMVDDVLPGERQNTLAADKGYDTMDSVRACRDRNVTPMSPRTTAVAVAPPSMCARPR